MNFNLTLCQNFKCPNILSICGRKTQVPNKKTSHNKQESNTKSKPKSKSNHKSKKTKLVTYESENINCIEQCERVNSDQYYHEELDIDEKSDDEKMVLEKIINRGATNSSTSKQNNKKRLDVAVEPSDEFSSNEKIYDLLAEINLLVDSLTNTKEVILDRLLQKMKRILQCEYYILHIIKVNQDDSTNFVSKSFIRDCQSGFRNLYISKEMAVTCAANLSKQNDNIYGYILTSKEYYITNNIYDDERSACRIPDGHPTITSFMGIPLINKFGKVIAIMGFANSKKSLCDADYELIQPICDTFCIVVEMLISR